MSGFPQVSNPKNVPLRPLDGGMVLNKSSQLLEKGQCIDAKNYIITQNGPKRRPGYEPYGGGVEGYEGVASIPYRFIDLFNFWTSGEGGIDQQLLLLTDGPMYQVGVGGMAEVPWTYDTGTIDIIGNTVSGSGTSFLTADLYPGDLVRCNGGEGRISEIIADTGIELEAGHTLEDVSGASYSIQRAFNDDARYLADWVVYNDLVIITDYNAPPVVYDYTQPEGSQFSLFIESDYKKLDVGNGPEDFVARCVAVFQDRIYFGNTIEVTDGVRRNRIRWSSAVDPGDFSNPLYYQDLPYTQGSIVRIVPLNNLLIVYFTDAIYVGTPTQNPNLPVQFQQAETGVSGLVGMKAITSYLDGHFFVGQDDVYMMTTRGPKRIGTPVAQRTVKESEVRERIYAALDIENQRIVFGFTKARRLIEEVWSYQYRTGGWSYDEFETYMLANPLSAFELTWEGLAGFTWDTIGETFETWDSMSVSENVARLYAESNGSLRQLSTNLGVDRVRDENQDLVEVPIESAYETGDFDFNEPDRVKTFLRLSLKVDFDTPPLDDVLFAVQASHNRGRSWETLGTLTVREQHDEGYINFLITSSHVRFRTTTSDNVGSFTISEIVLKVRRRGEELTEGLQSE